MEQYRALKRDGCAAQFAVHVKNAEALLDVVSAVASMALTLEVLAPAGSAAVVLRQLWSAGLPVSSFCCPSRSAAPIAWLPLASLQCAPERLIAPAFVRTVSAVVHRSACASAQLCHGTQRRGVEVLPGEATLAAQQARARRALRIDHIGPGGCHLCGSAFARMQECVQGTLHAFNVRAQAGSFETVCLSTGSVKLFAQRARAASASAPCTQHGQ